MATSSTFTQINIGSAPNDGTGNNIRDAFNTVNLNFQALYQWVFGTTGSVGFKFINLLDTPNNYTTGTSNYSNYPIITGVNSAGNGMINSLLVPGPGISITVPQQGTILISSNTTTNTGSAGSATTVLVGTNYESASTNPNPNTIAARDNNGNLSANTFNGLATTAQFASLATSATYATALVLNGNIYTPSTGSTPNSIVIRDINGNIPGSGSGGNSTSSSALLVNGTTFEPGSTAATANTVAARDSAGNITANQFIGTATLALNAAYANNAGQALSVANLFPGQITATLGNTPVFYANTATFAVSAGSVSGLSVGTYSIGNYYPTMAAGTGVQPQVLSTPFYYNNGVVYSTDFAATSDSKLKNVVGTVSDALAKVSSINGVNFYWNETAKQKGINDTSLQLGVLAQEIKSVAPEAVNEDSEGNLSVKYDKLIPILIEAIKELNKKVDDLSGAR